MHELSITQALFKLTLDEAAASGAQRVIALTVQVGVLTGIDASALVFYFATMSKGSCAEGAQIRFEKIIPTARCQQCGHTIPLAEPDLAGRAAFNHTWLESYTQLVCERCQGTQFELVGGDEFALISLEIE